MDDNIENEPLSFEDPDSTLFESIPVLKEKINFLEIMVQQLNSRVASLEAINFPHVTSMAMVNQEYPAEWSLKGQKDYITYAEKKLSLLKRDNEWRKNFLAIQFEGLSSESKDRIISAINKQRVSASRIVNTIAKEVLGIDAIKNYSIGCHGMAIAVGSSHMFSRPPLAEDEENKLRAVLGFIEQIFVTKDGWEYLVRRPVNQMGREFKSGKRDSLDIAELFKTSNKAKRPSNIPQTLTSAEPTMAITQSDQQEKANPSGTISVSNQNVNQSRDINRAQLDFGHISRPLSSISSNFLPISRKYYQSTLDTMFSTTSRASSFDKDLASKDGEKDKQERPERRYI